MLMVLTTISEELVKEVTKKMTIIRDLKLNSLIVND